MLPIARKQTVLQLNPADGRKYIISYNDCCGKSSCGACLCNRNEGDRPVYITGKANAGTARIFEWNGSAWAQVAELLPWAYVACAAFIGESLPELNGKRDAVLQRIEAGEFGEVA